MTESEYRAHPAISYSDLKNLKISYNYFLESKKGKPSTQSMEFGTAFHTLFLEPEKFKTDYIVTDLDRRTKAYKELIEANPNAKILTESEFTKLTNMAESARQKFEQMFGLNYLEDFPTQIETPYFANLISDIESKCKPDLILPNERIIIDLKSTQSAYPDEFTRAITTYHYGLQAAYYLAVTGMDRFLFLATESQAPYQSCFYELKKEDLNIFLNEAFRLLNLYKSYKNGANKTHDYGVHHTISLPNYYTSKLIEEALNNDY